MYGALTNNYTQRAKIEADVPAYLKETFEQQLLTTILLANLPFQVVENKSF